MTTPNKWCKLIWYDRPVIGKVLHDRTYTRSSPSLGLLDALGCVKGVVPVRSVVLILGLIKFADAEKGDSEAHVVLTADGQIGWLWMEEIEFCGKVSCG